MQWKEDIILVTGKLRRHHLADISMDSRMILKCSLRNYSGRFLLEA
jgi:hypothetical protein